MTKPAKLDVRGLKFLWMLVLGFWCFIPEQLPFVMTKKYAMVQKEAMRMTGIKVNELPPITGKEANIDPTTPSGALAEFYLAYNSRNLSLMEKNWLTTPDASMNNPLGGMCRGWPEIREFYIRIFASPASVRVEFYDYMIFHWESAFLAVGREHGTSQSQDLIMELYSRTSRFYVMMDGRWRQFHHHGSIDDPGLLKLYQEAIP